MRPPPSSVDVRPPPVWNRDDEDNLYSNPSDYETPGSDYEVEEEADDYR